MAMSRLGRRRERWPALFAAVAIVWLPGAVRAAGVPNGTYIYSVIHPILGDIGTFSNVISQDKERVIVETRLRIAAKLWFVTVRRIEAERREVWEGSKLALYDSTTRKDGRLITVHGHAEGNSFVVWADRGAS